MTAEFASRSAKIAYGLVFAYCARSLIQYGSQQHDRATFFLIPRERGVFADLAQLTFSAECNATAEQLLQNERTCDPFRRPFNYTPFSLDVLRSLGVQADQCLPLGVALGFLAILALTFFFVVSISDRRAAWTTATLALLSFPLQLGMERGNHDLFVSSCCLAFVALALHSHRLSPVLGGLVGFVATAAKIFPAPGFLLWTVSGKKIERTRLLMFLPVAMALAWQADAIPWIQKNTPRPAGGLSFGIECAFQDYFDPKLAPALIALKGVLMLATAYILYNKLRPLPLDPSPTISTPIAYFQCFGWMFLVVYFASRSWDYRLILLLGLVPYLLNWAMTTNAKDTLIPKLVLGLVTFVSFEQYALSFGKIGTTFHIASDLVVQPILIGAIGLILILLAVTPTGAARP